MAIRPPLLEPGDTIGVVTLGSPENEEIINERINTLEGLGFKVVLGEHVYARNGFFGRHKSRACL